MDGCRWFCIMNWGVFGEIFQYSIFYLFIFVRFCAVPVSTKIALQVSQELKFLTGDETKTMMKAHLQAGLVVGEPFVDRWGAVTPTLPCGHWRERAAVCTKFSKSTCCDILDSGGGAYYVAEGWCWERLAISCRKVVIQLEHTPRCRGFGR